MVNNPENQEVMSRGEQTLVQKLTNLPFSYFCDSFLKDVLFPTLIQIIHNNLRNLQIMSQEMSLDMIIQYLKQQMTKQTPTHQISHQRVVLLV